MKAELKCLYTLAVCKDNYRNYHMVVVLVDTINNRYIWQTTSKSQALNDLSSKVYKSCSFKVTRNFPCGDKQISNVRCL